MKRSHLIFLIALALPLSLFAQRRGPDRDDAPAGPALGVARVSLADGDVHIVRPSGDEFQAQASMPLVADDVILTGVRSRAEVQFDTGNFLRLAPESRVRMVSLGNKSFRMEVVSGVASYSQLKGGEADVAVETDLASVRIVKRAVFTVERRDVGQTDVTVREGVVEVVTDQGTERLKKGHLTARGKPDDVQIRTAKAEPKDDFDKWNNHRNKILRRDTSYRSWGPYWPSYAGFGYGWGWPYYGYWGPSYRTVVVHRGGRGGGRHRR